jgi:hypothetical protein
MSQYGVYDMSVKIHGSIAGEMVMNGACCDISGRMEKSLLQTNVFRQRFFVLSGNQARRMNLLLVTQEVVYFQGIGSLTLCYSVFENWKYNS